MVYPRTDAASAGHSRFGTDESGSDFLLPFDGEGATAEIDGGFNRSFAAERRAFGL